jgi:hypothetical protein
VRCEITDANGSNCAVFRDPNAAETSPSQSKTILSSPCQDRHLLIEKEVAAPRGDEARWMGQLPAGRSPLVYLYAEVSAGVYMCIHALHALVQYSHKSCYSIYTAHIRRHTSHSRTSHLRHLNPPGAVWLPPQGVLPAPPRGEAAAGVHPAALPRERRAHPAGGGGGVT